MLYCFPLHCVIHKFLLVSYWLTYFINCIRVPLLLISQLMCQRWKNCRWMDRWFMLVTKGVEVWSWSFAFASDLNVTHFAIIGSPLDRASRPIKPKLLMHVFTLMTSKDEFVMVLFVAFPHFWSSWWSKFFTCALCLPIYFSSSWGVKDWNMPQHFWLNLIFLTMFLRILVLFVAEWNLFQII